MRETASVPDREPRPALLAGGRRGLFAYLPTGAIGALLAGSADAAPSETRRPKELPYVRPEDYGAVTGDVSMAQRTANVAAIIAARNVAFAAGKTLLFSGATYQIDGRLDFSDGMDVVGAHTKTRVEQYGSGIDIIHWGPAWGNPSGLSTYGGRLSGFQLVHMTDQTGLAVAPGNAGAALSVTAAFFARFENLQIGEVGLPVAGHARYANQGLCFDRIGGAFSCIFENITIKGWAACGLNAQATSSGNAWRNIMVCNGEYGGTIKPGGIGAQFTDGSGVIDQLNLEWMICGTASGPASPLYVGNCRGLVFRNLHMEGCQLAAPYPLRWGFIVVTGTSLVRFENIDMVTAVIQGGIRAAGLITFFSAGSSAVTIGELRIEQTTKAPDSRFYAVTTHAAPDDADDVKLADCEVAFAGAFMCLPDGKYGSKLDGWTDCHFAPTTERHAAISRPSWTFQGEAYYSLKASGTYEQTALDGVRTYAITAETALAFKLATTISRSLPMAFRPPQGIRRKILNMAVSTGAITVHGGSSGVIVTLQPGKWGEFVFDEPNMGWRMDGEGPAQ